MGLTPAQALTSVRDQYAESGSGFFTDAEIRSYLWDGERQISNLLQCNEVTTSITTVTGTQEYARQGLITIGHITYDGDKLKKVDFRSLYAADGDATTSDASSGSPVYYYEWGSNIGLWPIPDASSTVKIWGMDECAQITTASTAFTIDGSLTNGIPYYAMSIMSAKDNDDGKAGFYLNLWERSKAEASKVWDERKDTDMIWTVKDEYSQPTTGRGMP